MRALFLLLIAVNLAYFGWEAIYRPQQEHTSGIKAPTVKSAGAGLILLSETPEVARSSEGSREVVDNAASQETGSRKQVAVPSPAATPNGPPATSPTHCYQIVGLEEKNEADELAAILQQKGAQLLGRGANQEGYHNYWVMIPPFKSRAAAQEVISELQDRGMRDFFLVRSGEHENAISLGVFSTETAALRRLQRIRALSLSGPGARLDHIRRTAKQYWIEVQWPGKEEPRWKGLVPEIPQIRVTPISCSFPR